MEERRYRSVLPLPYPTTYHTVSDDVKVMFFKEVNKNLMNILLE